MRSILFGCVAVVAGACAGPGQQRLTGTHAAMTRPIPATAPSASTSDREREHVVQQFADMRATQQAHLEANERHPPHAPLPGAQPPPFPQPMPQLAPFAKR